MRLLQVLFFIYTKKYMQGTVIAAREETTNYKQQTLKTSQQHFTFNILDKLGFLSIIKGIYF